MSLKIDKKHSIFIGKLIPRKEIFIRNRSRLSLPLGLLVVALSLLVLHTSAVDATGQVYHLKQLSDFEGVYASAEAGASAGSGPAVTAMQNPHGVVLHLRVTQEGVKLTLAAEGVNIDLKNVGAGSE